jgi:hypothetical protein
MWDATVGRSQKDAPEKAPLGMLQAARGEPAASMAAVTVAMSRANAAAETAFALSRTLSEIHEFPAANPA